MMIMTVHSQFSSVQDGIYAPRKAHMRFTPSVRNGSNVRLFDDGFLSSFQGRSSSASSFHASLFQAIDGVSICSAQKQVWQDKSEDGMYMMMMMMMTVHLQCS